MGTGIAQLVLTAGHALHVVDREAAPLDAIRQTLAGRLGREALAGRLDGDPTDLLRKLATHRQVLDIGFDVAMEAVPERRDAKREVLNLLLERTAAIPVATTSLAMPVGSLVEESTRAGRVLGFHFMNPAPALRLCELVVPANAERTYVASGRAFLEGLGLTVVEAPDQAGFVLNRTHVPFLLGAIERVMEGVSAEDVDAVFVVGCRHPMGPLAIADLVGLDVLLAIAETLDSDEDGGRFTIPPLLREKVAAGDLGRKSGAGFFVYDA
jgi:3-hydroxybutyryl-CoA dehydrogenase